MSGRRIAVIGAAFLAFGACHGPAREAASTGTTSKKTDAADGKTQAFLQGFASAIVARDYASAYNAVAAERRATLTQQDLEEAFRHYRDGLRDRVVSEGTIHFEPGGEAEGFSATVWVVMEAGEPKLAAFYVED